MSVRSIAGPMNAPVPTMLLHTPLRLAVDQCSGFHVGTDVWKNGLMPPPATDSIA
jgi:hypothetical protein